MKHREAFDAMKTIQKYCKTRGTCQDCIFKRESGWASQSCKVGFPRNYIKITKKWLEVIRQEG